MLPETMLKFRAFTGKSEDEIMQHVSGIDLQYDDLLTFYKCYGRFPDAPTVTLIKQFGVVRVIEAIQVLGYSNTNKMKRSIDINHIIHEDHTALIVLAPTGIAYTAQVGGMLCDHPEAEGFLLSLGDAYNEVDACDYGCEYFQQDQEKVIQFAKDFDLAASKYNRRYTIRFDHDRIKEAQEGWIPVVINGRFDDGIYFNNEKGIIYTGNCD